MHICYGPNSTQGEAEDVENNHRSVQANTREAKSKWGFQKELSQGGDI